MLCFFNLAGAIYDPDDKGMEVPTIGDARILAARHLAEIIRDQPDSVWKGDEVRVEVTDANQLLLFTIIAVGVDAPAGASHPLSFRPEA